MSRTDAETGEPVPDCGNLGCKLQTGHTGPHMTDAAHMWFIDEEWVYKPEEWYKEHPA